MIPVFIGGCDRSGTTLLGAMLGAHSRFICTPESQFKTDVLLYFNLEAEKVNFESVLNMIKKSFRFKIWEFDLKSVSNKEIWASYPELITWLIKEYAIKMGKNNPEFWVDHTPSNIKYAATLFKMFPEAKMIHIVRDGRAVASSVIPLDWGPNTIDGAAHWWLENIAYGLALESSLDRSKIIRVKYEDLVIKPEETLRVLCEYIGVSYESQMAQGCGFKVPKFTISQHPKIGKRLDIKRINAWKSELKPRQIEIFESLTYEVLSYLGYYPNFGIKAKQPTALERFIFKIYDFFKRKINRVIFFYRICSHRQ